MLPAFQFLRFLKYPAIHDLQFHLVAEAFPNRLQAARQSSLNRGHYTNGRAATEFLEALQGVFQRLFGRGVHRDNDRLQARSKYLLYLSERRLGIR